MYILIGELLLVGVSLWIGSSYAIIIATLIASYLTVVRTLEKITISDLHQRPVLITGCRAGFGYDLAMRCLKSGIPVFAAFHSNRGRKEFEADASKIPHSERLLHTLILDVANEKSVEAARQFVEEHLHLYKGKLWGLVNNAGVVGTGWDEYVTPKDYEYLLQVNTLGVIRVTHAFKHLIKQSKGRIVIMSSVMGKVALPLFCTYSVAKFALNGFTDCLRYEMAKFGVSVIGIEAGFFVTPLADTEAAAAKLEEVWRSSAKHGEYTEEHMRWTQRMIRSFRYLEDPDVSKVTDVYMSALTSAFPRSRWLAGRDAITVWGPLSLLPTRILDALLRFFGSYLMREPKPFLAAQQKTIAQKAATAATETVSFANGVTTPLQSQRMQPQEISANNNELAASQLFEVQNRAIKV